MAQTSVAQTSVEQITLLSFRCFARRMANLSDGKKLMINSLNCSSHPMHDALHQRRINVDATRLKSWKLPTLMETILFHRLRIITMPKHHMSSAKWYIQTRSMKTDGTNVHTVSISSSINKRQSITNQIFIIMKTQITIDIIFAVLFFALFIAALVGIIRGAWWHIGTAVISYIIFSALRKETKNESI